jgi:uncharacterized protein with HEPN domain
MPERDWRIRITDILEAIHRIERYRSDMDFDTFQKDEKTIDAVIRNLEVIGEAANYVPESVQANHPEIPWRQIRGIRNTLAHEYFGVSLSIIWVTIQQDLEPLILPLSRIIDQQD